MFLPRIVAGVHCETDIDECSSSPCVHGQCVDSVNEYTCVCDPGYHGNHCETEIDECRVYRPCLNGATCIDRIAAYTCECPSAYRGVSYGGENCTVRLTGCESNLCVNGATCSPFLVDEPSNVHDYICVCAPGFARRYCIHGTTATFGGATWMMHERRAIVSVSLRFRTTLPSGLLVNLVTDAGDNVVLQLVDSETLQVISSDATTATATTLHAASLSDASWHQVGLVVNETGLSVTLQDCVGDDACVSYLAWNDGARSFDAIYVGGNSSSLRVASGITLSPGFIGCIQDVTIDSELVLVPNDFLSKGLSSGLEVGCPREEQCVPDPCYGHGTCADLWSAFQCTCRRPYYDVDCSQCKCACVRACVHACVGACMHACGDSMMS